MHGHHLFFFHHGNAVMLHILFLPSGSCGHDELCPLLMDSASSARNDPSEARLHTGQAKRIFFSLKATS